MWDLVIRGGRIVDGTGREAFEGDVAIDGGKIVEVGKVSTRGKREVNASGRLVTPGFVDMHTHYDAQVTWDPQMTPSSWHGCTTVVMGNCGVGFAPAAPERHDWLIGLMEGVEDIPGAAMHEGIQWEWETFPEYLDAIGSKARAIDFAAQIPHGALRAYVMGERGADNEEATADDIVQMKRLVREALDAGAVGFSTSRTLLHKSIEGVPVPGTFASRQEIFGIGEALKESGKGVYQLAVDHLNVPKEFVWMKDLARDIRRPVMFNLSQTDMKPKLWKDLVAMLDEAAAEDLPVWGQVAGRAIGVLMNWRGTAHPFARHQTFVDVLPLADEPGDAFERALSDESFKAKLLAEADPKLPFFEAFITRSWHKMYPTGDAIDYEPSPDQTVKAIAARTGKSPQEICYDALMHGGGKGMIYFPLFNYADGDLELLRELHLHPRTRMGLSDAGAHCGAVCDGGMPTFMLTHWTRDRTRGERIPLETIIRRQTRDTALTFGLDDRGVLAPGLKGDVNIIDYDGLHFEQPKLVHDLPAGGRRLIQRAKGYVATFVGGTAIVERDEPTGELPGRLVRK